ncbi:MAG: DUF421 domain-containing protein [Hoeflea sp.]|uniref:DUF421 domain-containing protein n=1 Tax=Hoeflea sp. TaxID=1940281 RepID=UPI0032EEFD78
MFFETEPYETIAAAIALSLVALAWVILVVRLIGLRTFSKMTAFDFVVTVATGSLLAGACQSDSWSAFWQTLMAIGVLLGLQYVTARLRKSSESFDQVVQNSPVLLMQDGVILNAALTRTRVAEDDLIAKLREANVLDLADIRAVVLETTGDISVLHGQHLDPKLLQNVTRID